MADYQNSYVDEQVDALYKKLHRQNNRLRDIRIRRSSIYDA
jgi:hypothetical protein